LGGAAVDVGPDQLGVAARAIVLAGHLPLFESRRERLFSRDTKKMPTNRTAAVSFYAFFNAPRKSSLKIRNQTSSLSYCYY
jgi:hypothetical protein